MSCCTVRIHVLRVAVRGQVYHAVCMSMVLHTLKYRVYVVLLVARQSLIDLLVLSIDILYSSTIDSTSSSRILLRVAGILYM